MESTTEEATKEKLEPIKIRITADDLSRSSSPNVSSVPVSIRQQMALIKQLEQFSPSGSTDSERPSTPSSRKKNRDRIHKKNNHGETPLHVAARKGQTVVCEDLIQQGADVNASDYAGWTPLHEACHHRAFDVAKLLIEHNADVNKASDDGQTPLHDASANSDIQICWLLLRNDANRLLRNNKNQRPIDLARDQAIANILMNNTVPEACPPELPPSPPPKMERRKVERNEATPPPEPTQSDNTVTSSTNEDVLAEIGITHLDPEPSSYDDSIATSDAVETSMPSAEHLPSASSSQEEPSRTPSDGQAVSPYKDSAHELNLSEATTPTSSRNVSPGHTFDASMLSRSPSPEHRGASEENNLTEVYEYGDDGDELSRGERTKGKSVRGGKVGKPGKTNSGTATPVGKKSKSLRGGRGGSRGRGAGRTAELAVEQIESALAEDPYAFRATPDSESDDRMDDREASVGPSVKRSRYDPEDQEEEQEEDDESIRGTVQKKVPILRISLAKAPSEENDETVSYGKGKNLGNRGKTGKRGAEAEEQRVTRSKVRQAGRGLDDSEPWSGKKKRHRQVPEPIVEEPNEDYSMARLMERQPTPKPEQLTEGQKILYMPPYAGIYTLRKTLENRWQEDVKKDVISAGNAATRFSTLLYCSAVRSGVKPEDEQDIKFPQFPHDLDGDPSVRFLWEQQEEQRRLLLERMKMDRHRLQLCYEQEYIRMERRRDGTAPQMSAVRLFRERELLNPLILDEPVHTAPQIDKEAFFKKVGKGVLKLYREHKMDTEQLNCTQRHEWRQIFSKRRTFGSDEAEEEDFLNRVAPVVPPDILHLNFGD